MLRCAKKILIVRHTFRALDKYAENDGIKSVALGVIILSVNNSEVFLWIILKTDPLQIERTYKI